MAEIANDAGADLARWAATGDRAALDRALALAADAAHAQASRLLGRSADADDATQEALVQLVRSARRYDPARPFRPWLARLVHDACCRLLRSGRRRRRHEGAVPPPPPPAEPVDGEAVRAAVLELPESLRAAVELHYFAGLEQAEAAAALGIGEGACAMRLSRARERLRGLLQRRGVGVAAAAALMALGAAPAHAAPSGLAAGVAARAAAGTLPATTIPLTTLQIGAWFMATHPITTTAVAAVLVAALSLPFTLAAGEASPPVPAPAAAPLARWSAPARALLPYLDADAAFLLAGDLETLRPQLLAAKPFSLFADPQLATQRAAWRQLADAPMALLPMLARRLAEDGRAVTFALHDSSRGRRPEGRTMLLADLGAGADQTLRAVADAGGKDGAKPPNVGPFTGLLVEDRELLIARSGNTLAIAATDWLQRRIGAPPAAEPPAAAWFRLDAGPLLARYAALAGAQADPAAVAAVLGTGWRGLRPVVEGRIGTASGEITAAVQVTRAAPFSPLVPLTLLLGGTAQLPLGDCASWPMRRPTIAIPASADRVASLNIGLTLPPPAQPFTRAVTEIRKNPGNVPRDLALRMLADAWSGDLALELCPGAPLPRAALVLGLRPGTDPIEAVRQLALALELPGGTLERAGALPQAVSGFVAGGQLTITACADRLLATWNAEAADWPGLATAVAAADAPACAMSIDLPAAARTWGTLALMAVPAEQRALLPPLPVLIQHLPVWQLRWEATPDGCRIEERGLPLAAILIAAAAINTVLDADPEAESRRGAVRVEPPPAAPPPAAF